MTKDQIPKATGDDLSRLAGEVLQPEKQSHDYQMATYHTINKTWTCRFCYKTIKANKLHEKCTHANLIPLTWPEAMKWRDWAVGEFGAEEYTEALWQIWKQILNSETPFDEWLATKAQPEHYIKAAMLCKIGGE